MKKNTKLFRIIILSMVLVLSMSLLIGCDKNQNAVTNSKENTEKQTDEQIKPKQEIVIGVGRNFYYGAEDDTCLHGSTNVWEGLTYIDDEMNVKPELAESWNVSDDGKVWTFNLRKGVKFHDGTPFNADAAINNMNRLLNHPNKGDVKNTYGEIEEISKVDEYTIQFKHKNIIPDFPSRISYHNSAIFSLSSFDEKGNLIKPIGTGPFIFKDYVKDDCIIIEKNKDYWGKEPKLEKVVFKYIPDPSTRLAALENGEIDVIADVGAVMPEQAISIKNNDELELKTKTVATTHYLHFNKNGIFKDDRLIQSVSMSFDREKLINSVLEGYGIPAKSVITPLATYWLNNNVAPKYDIEEAKKLAKQALNGNNPQVKIVLNTGIAKRWPYKPIAEILQQRLAEIGLDVNIEMVDGGLWSKKLKAGDYDITIAPYTLMTGEPNFFFGNIMLTEGNLNKNRCYGYSNKEVDELIKKAAIEKDKEKRKKIYFKLQEIAALEGPAIPIYHDVTIYAVNKKVKDFTMDASFKPQLVDVEVVNMEVN